MGSQMKFDCFKNHNTLAKAQDYTDAGNRDRFVSEYQADLRYVVDWKQWLKKQGTIWKPATPGELQEKALRIINQIALAADAIIDPNAKASVLNWAKQSQSRAKLNAMISMSAMWPDMEANGAEFDTNIHLLATDNEIVDLESPQQVQRPNEILCTLKANAFHNEEADCPLFKSFLNQVFCGDSELIAWMQTALGYSISGSTEEQVLFMAHGQGSNGKSTLMEVILEVIGSYGRTADINQFMQRDKHGIRTLEQIAFLKGVRLAVASELEGNARLNEALLKRLTGGDTLTAARLHKEQFTFSPHFKIWMLMNHLPLTEDNTEGFWRRIRVVPFNANFETEKRQIGIKQKLLLERDGILNWLIVGARKWHARKINTGNSGLGWCKAVEEATRNYRGDYDLIQRFLDDRTHSIPGSRTPSNRLYSSYEKWTQETQGTGPVSQPAFSRAIEARGHPKKRTAAGFEFRGVELK